METPALSKTKLKDLSRIRDKRFRRSSRLFLIEGATMIREWLASKYVAEWVVTTTAFADSQPEVLRSITKRDAVLYTAHAKDVERLSDTETPQGIVAALRQPDESEQEWIQSASRTVLLLDHISDPGNLGTMIRTAEWFGASHVACSTSCVEVFNPKVVRATMGSIFKTHVLTESHLESLMVKLGGRGYRRIAAAVRGGAPSDGSSSNERTALVVGSESHGISSSVQALCDASVSIPQSGHAESLNAAVACGILLYELRNR